MEIKTEASLAEAEYDEMKYFMTAIMDAGELLAAHGAEVSRVEDTITRLCMAYGFARADVFTITSSIIVTAISADGRAVTQTRRIRTRDTDLGRVARVNELSRRICACPISLEEFKREAGCHPEKGKKASVRLELGMHMMIAAALSVFFGGTGMDGMAAALSGAVLYGMLHGSSILKLIPLFRICFAAQ